MNFRTEIQLQKGDFTIDHSSRIFLSGSCFTQNIGSLLAATNFKATMDPFGIVFSPLALTDRLQVVMGADEVPDLLSNNGFWHSFLAHSKRSLPDRSEMEADIAKSIRQTKTDLLSSDVLILTWGTAYGYRHIDMDRVVSNCHKFPQSAFSKELASVETVVKTTADLLETLRKDNPDLKVIITVSPVRHWKDGGIENSRSKAILIESAHRLVDLGHVMYFPSYELLIDDLRDYRFYNADMLHPSPVAIDYVWKRFRETFMSEDTRELVDLLQRLDRSLSHTFIKATDRQKEEFRASVENQFLLIRKKVPEVDLSVYRKRLDNLIS